jgi:hypothetical protein
LAGVVSTPIGTIRAMANESRETVAAPATKVVIDILGHPAWIVQRVQKDAIVPVFG